MAEILAGLFLIGLPLMILGLLIKLLCAWTKYGHCRRHVRVLVKEIKAG